MGPFAIAIIAMAFVVMASNYLVQYPVEYFLGPVNLADTLTWGAFTYPIAFLVTDLVNRQFGAPAARKVVISGFVLALCVPMAFWVFNDAFTTPRILVASGTAFLVAQFLDVALFDRMRRMTWWKAPVISSLTASLIDTVMFFGLAFAAAFAFIDTGFGMEDGSLPFTIPLFGVSGAFEVPLWMSLAAGDYMTKILVATLLLAPYRIFLGYVGALPKRPAA